ncbi:MAG: ferredoxin family protein [Thermoplasmata archaeon]|nr:ferredoxin family protein [Thermoplasmata archaeon]
MHPEINPDYCKGCHLCVHVCPKKVYSKSEKISKRGAVLPAVDHPEQCVNAKKSTGEKLSCELCVLSCPDQAIKLVGE